MLSPEGTKYTKNWPATYAIVEHKVVDEESQQWYWDEKNGSIRNGADPTFFLDNDFGWAMTADTANKSKSEHFPATPRKWFYDDEWSELTTEIDGVHTALATLGQPQNWEAV